MSRSPYNRHNLFWLLALTVTFRSLIVPGLTPVADADSPLGFNIAFCDELYQPTDSYLEELAGTGHGLDHHHDTGTGDGHDHNRPLSSQCDISILGGIFIEAPAFDIGRYLQPPRPPVPADYASPDTRTPQYFARLSRAPPPLFAV